MRTQRSYLITNTLFPLPFRFPPSWHQLSVLISDKHNSSRQTIFLPKMYSLFCLPLYVQFHQKCPLTCCYGTLRSRQGLKHNKWNTSKRQMRKGMNATEESVVLTLTIVCQEIDAWCICAPQTRLFSEDTEGLEIWNKNVCFLRFDI